MRSSYTQEQYPPKTSLPALRKRRQQVVDFMESMGIYGLRLHTAYMDELVDYLLDKLPPDEDSPSPEEQAVFRDAREVVLRDLLRSFQGKKVDEALMNRIGQYYAGYYGELAEAVPYFPWDTRRGPIWGCVHVVDVQRWATRTKKLYRVEFESHAGPSVGYSWSRVVAGGYLQVLIRDAGAHKYEKYEDVDVSDFWFDAYMVPGKNIEFMYIEPSSSQEKHNKELSVKRRQECSGGFYSGVCFNCPYGRRQCRLSRHVEPYKDEQVCLNPVYTESGQKKYHKGVMPSMSQGVCLACLNRGLFHKEAFQAKKKGETDVGPAKRPAAKNSATGSVKTRFRAWNGLGKVKR